MSGTPTPITWTRLASPATAGDTSIVVVDAVEWGPGDEVGISPTDFDNTQLDYAVIVDVGADNRTLTLDRPLVYNHSASALDVPAWAGKGGGSPRVALAAAVGLLTRNVRVVGLDVNAVPPMYGAHVDVGEMPATNGAVAGSLDLR